MASITQTLIRDGNMILWHDYRAGDVQDLSGNNHHGTLQNAPKFSRIGFLLNGDNQNIIVSDHDDLSFTDDSSDSAFSLVWYGDVSATEGAPHYLIAKNPSVTGATVNEYSMWLTNAERLYFRLHDASENASIAEYTSPLPLNEFKFLAGTYDGSGAASGISLYIDGIVQSTSNGDSGSYVAMENLGNDLSFGRWNLYHKQDVTNIMIIDKELSGTEIAQLYSEIANNTY